MKQLPVVIHSCLQCPYFVEGGWAFNTFKDGNRCNYGRKFVLAGIRIPNDCPLDDWNYGDPLTIKTGEENEKKTTGVD
jgi:hypothetical protein